jgi:predicted CoA-binding protein
VIKKLNQKLATEYTIISQADKGKTVVIINSDEYSKKVHTFLTSNNFHVLPSDPTEKYQKLLHKAAKMQLKHKQTKHKIPNSKETLTTNTKSTTKIIQN